MISRKSTELVPLVKIVVNPCWLLLLKVACNVGRRKSESINNTFWPVCAHTTATLSVTVDFPSLTLAEVIAKVLIGLSIAIKLIFVRIVRNCSEIGLFG